MVQVSTSMVRAEVWISPFIPEKIIKQGKHEWKGKLNFQINYNYKTHKLQIKCKKQVKPRAGRRKPQERRRKARGKASRRSLNSGRSQNSSFPQRNGPPLNMRRHIIFLKDNRVTIKNTKHVQKMHKNQMGSQSKIELFVVHKRYI